MMKSKKWYLVLIWSNGTRDIFTLKTEKEALARGLDFKMIFGDKIVWYGVLKKRPE